jgi:hypothetical protein
MGLEPGTHKISEQYIVYIRPFIIQTLYILQQDNAVTGSLSREGCCLTNPISLPCNLAHYHHWMCECLYQPRNVTMTGAVLVFVRYHASYLFKRRHSQNKFISKGCFQKMFFLHLLSKTCTKVSSVSQSTPGGQLWPPEAFRQGNKLSPAKKLCGNKRKRRKLKEKKVVKGKDGS